MRKFLWAVRSVSTFSHMDKEEKSLSSKMHIGMVWTFYTFSLDLKISEILAALTFLTEKISIFAESEWYMYALWLLITLCNMPKGLVT